jgi:hypothetical protein
MGLHFLNGDLLDEVNKTGVFDATRPQIVLYEPSSDGSLRLTGADFLVFADAWNAKHPNDPPQLMGQLFHFFDAPNRFGLQAFYTLHVWAWKDNPDGAFGNWHPDVWVRPSQARTIESTQRHSSLPVYMMGRISRDWQREGNNISEKETQTVSATRSYHRY